MARASVINDFIDRLREAEDRKDATALCSLFSADAKLDNLTRPSVSSISKAKSSNSVTQFWNQYLSAFDRINSHFTHIIETEGSAVLEWHSSGTLPMGLPIEYCGVSILEHDGEKVTAFRTYYDSAALLPHAPHVTKTFSESVGTPDIRTDASS